MSQLVKLVSYSKSALAADHNLMDQIAFAARVSNPSNQHNKETNDRLVSYLIRNNHWSPFEMVSVCLEINTTRDIARQILRHRSFSFQEFSQRYADASQLGHTFREARFQDLKNRQNSIELSKEDADVQVEWNQTQQMIWDLSIAAYQSALESGIAKEVARSVLPEGLTNSRLYMSGTLRSWIHYIQLRAANGTQKEHREIALACADVLYKIFPHETINVG